MFSLISYVSSHVGKVRHNNEDNFLFHDKILENNECEMKYRQKKDTSSVCLFGVFDGMGGHEYGEKASLITASTARDFSIDQDYILEGLNQICHVANHLVCIEMKALKERIGCTASMVAFYKNKAYVCNIGDSPIYLYRNHTLTSIYEEHTERRMYEKIYGKVIPGKKYRLTQNIGIFKEEMMIKPYLYEFEIQEGDCLLLCSDGLTDMVSDEQITYVLNHCSKKDQMAVLENMALEAGGKDNITIELIYIDKLGIFDFFRK